MRLFASESTLCQAMQTIIFNFKTKTVGVVGNPTTQRALADILAAQQKIIATSPSTVSQPQVSR
jgi:hypothetical protein